ncbi:ParB/RepB/Spo0J family partition protein [Variovorax saccharolyticus]|uniref:ParB/RepB/Spo0J family partition protein n=1 Tax=Variovorax saccharolyticus TaxID=3053516 RepID=UPI002576A4F3|nr:ParB/RepB/Spo0J family partition protein [Variovorax sp. J22R187]MDM0022661.1 ParB/RepB/Spo0J family partition protein [Variovorax sp. J22R187]
MTVINPLSSEGVRARKGPPRKAKPTKAERATHAEAAAQTPPPAPCDLLVPLARLCLSEANVRKVHPAQGLAELATLIDAQGLLQRLGVVAQDDGRYAVVAGGRRLQAIQMLSTQGRWPEDRPVECRLFDAGRAVQVSLAENSGREAMHPADQIDAFRRLVEDEGLDVSQVADRFGVSPLTVQRRLRLARLAPRFIDLYRADEIGSDQLQALALVDDPALQEAIWDGLRPHDRSAWRLRDAITAEACTADSRLARFVGLEPYEAAGGAVRRDLFASAEDPSSIYLDNLPLLQTLAADKLQGIAAALQAEGWSWVDGAIDLDGQALRRCLREAESEREPTPEEALALETLSAQQRAQTAAYDRHQDEADPDSDDFERVEQQLADAIDATAGELSTLHDALRTWLPAQMARSGATVSLDYRGGVRIERGLVRPSDRAGSEPGAEMQTDATASDPASSPRPEFSERLMRDLTAHRTAALQAALMQNPRVALVTLVHRMAETVFGLYGAGDDVVKVSVRITGDTSLAQDASDYATSPAATLLAQAESAWGDRLPGSPTRLFQWLLAQPDATLLDLLAYCTARSVNAIAPRTRPADHSDALADALGVDMADWWVPTPTTYLASVSKAKALEAVQEATGRDAAQAVAKMKKAESVAYCARQLEGTRWLPSPLRIRSPWPGGPGDFE